VNAKDLASALSAAVDVPHTGEELGPGRYRLTPVGFQRGDASYSVRVEHEGMRHHVAAEAAPFSGYLLTSLVERLDEHPELRDEIAGDLGSMGWDLQSTPAQGSRTIFDAREGNSALLENEDVRGARVLGVCVRLTQVMLGSFAVTHIPAHTRPARRRDEATAENVSWVYDPSERDRATATHRRLENWLLERLEREGIRPLDPQGSIEFDLAWLEPDGSLSICEVKSTSGHEDGQIRLGLGQVLHYAARLRAVWPRSINPVLFVEDVPMDPIWPPLCDEHGVILAWPASWDAHRATGTKGAAVAGVDGP